MNSVFARRHRDERAAEAVAMLFVIPVLVILVLALIDVGMMFRARMLVENVARDAARGAASDGGNFNPRTNTINRPWDEWALSRLYHENNCTVSACKDGKMPSVSCDNMRRPGGGVYGGNVVERAGDTVTCIIEYPYEPINDELLNSPMGLGMGSLLKEFHVEVSARAETGNQSAFGSG